MADYNFCKMSEACLNFSSVELVGASLSLLQKQRQSARQGGVQSESFGTRTSSSHTKHDNLVVTIDTKARIQLEVKTSSFI